MSAATCAARAPLVELARRALFLPPQGSTMAGEIDALHFAVVGTTLAGAVGVASAALWFLVRDRRRHAHQATPRLESAPAVLLAKIGAPLVLFLAFWIVGFRQYVRLRVAPEGAMVVYVTARQWMWKFAHVDGPTAIDVLTVPVGRPVKLVMISRDVIHSLYVPAFRLKQDVVPGRFVTTWFEASAPGTYEIFCAEYCGVSHSRMRAVVVALAPEDFGRWRRDAQRAQSAAGAPGSPTSLGPSTQVPGVTGASADSMVARGLEVARARQCVACHTLDGQRHVGPTWVGLYGATVPLADGRSVLADEAYLTRSMMEPAVDVHAGFAAVMPSYQGVLEAQEVAALVELMKSLRDAPRDRSAVALPPLASASTSPSASASAEEAGPR